MEWPVPPKPPRLVVPREPLLVRLDLGTVLVALPRPKIDQPDELLPVRE